MHSLDIIKRRPWMVSLGCTIFILYPNIAWFFCRYMYDGTTVNFKEFMILFVIRFLYCWGGIVGAKPHYPEDGIHLACATARLTPTLRFWSRL